MSRNLQKNLTFYCLLFFNCLPGPIEWISNRNGRWQNGGVSCVAPEMTRRCTATCHLPAVRLSGFSVFIFLIFIIIYVTKILFPPSIRPSHKLVWIFNDKEKTKCISSWILNFLRLIFPSFLIPARLLRDICLIPYDRFIDSFYWIHLKLQIYGWYLCRVIYIQHVSEIKILYG